MKYDANAQINLVCGHSPARRRPLAAARSPLPLGLRLRRWRSPGVCHGDRARRPQMAAPPPGPATGFNWLAMAWTAGLARPECSGLLAVQVVLQHVRNQFAHGEVLVEGHLLQGSVQVFGDGYGEFLGGVFMG